MPELGCGENRVFLYKRGGKVRLGEFKRHAPGAGLAKVEYGRELDEISEGKFTIALPGATECCDLIDKAQPYAHEIVVFRSGKRVWEGPLRDIQLRSGSAVLYARDVLHWAEVTAHPGRPASQEGTAADLIWNDVLLAFEERADTNVLPYVYLPNGVDGPIINSEVTSFAQYYADDIEDLASKGANYTVNGRSITIWPESGTIGTTRLLKTGEHYLGELEIWVSGSDFADRASTIDKNGLISISNNSGTQPYYGIVERIVEAGETIGVPAIDRLTSLEVARRGGVVPVTINPVAPGLLSATAPVSFADLVPGVRVPLAVTDPICRKFDTTMILRGVSVVEDTAGEKVSIDLVRVGTDGYSADPVPRTMIKYLVKQQQLANRFKAFMARPRP